MSGISLKYIISQLSVPVIFKIPHVWLNIMQAMHFCILKATKSVRLLWDSY